MSSSESLRESSETGISSAENSTRTSSPAPIRQLQDRLVRWEPYRRALNEKRHVTSWVYEHGSEVVQVGKSDIYWQCKYCSKRYHGKATSSAIQHLLKSHKTVKRNESSPSPFSSSTVLDLQKQGAGLQATATQARLLARDLPFKDRLVQWIVVCHIAFTQVENPFFRALLLALSTSVASLLPRSHNTVREWIMADFALRKTEIKKMLHESKSDIHYSFDLWTSPNGYGLNGIVAHFVHTDYTVRAVLIALREVIGRHSGENIAAPWWTQFKTTT
jgi:hypothetical protein